MFRRPLTTTEFRRANVLKMWSIALCVARTYPKDIRGSVTWTHDNTAGSECYGLPQHTHTHYFTNHHHSL